jgi:hypothetical protein
MQAMTGIMTTLRAPRYAADAIADALEADSDLPRVAFAANLVAPILGLRRRFVIGVYERRSDEISLLYRLNGREAVEIEGVRGRPDSVNRFGLANRLAVLTEGRRRGRWWIGSQAGVRIVETRETVSGTIISPDPRQPRRRRPGRLRPTHPEQLVLIVT